MNGLFNNLHNTNLCRSDYVSMENIYACNGVSSYGGETSYGSGKYLRNIYSGNGILPNVYSVGTINDIYVK